MKINEIVIDGKRIGSMHYPYVVAELSANHNGRLEIALESIETAKRCGADAVKIQSYTADTMTIDMDSEDFYIRGGLWDGYKLYDLYKWAETPFEWHKILFEHAKKVGITIFSTPFDESAVDMLEELNTPAYKVASFEIIDLPLIKYIASKKKPMIISTGMANQEEIYEAVDTARSAGCNDIVLLHCVSSYPAPIEQSNLSTIYDLAKRFNAISGLSDHSIGNIAAITSVAYGASLIEKHFTLNRLDKGPDSEFSIEPNELEQICNDVRLAWLAKGHVAYGLQKAEEGSMKFRRSLYFVKSMKAGDIISEEHIRRIRPGYGLPPKYFESLIGRCVKVDISCGTPVKWNLIDGGE